MLFSRVASAAALAALGLASSAAAGPATTVSPQELSPRVQEWLCSPRSADAASPAQARVRGSRESGLQTLFAPGDAIVVETGSATLAPGQLHVAHRKPRSTVWAAEEPWLKDLVQTAGVVRIDTVSGELAVATVIWGCDGIERGDQLTLFVPPADLPAGAGPDGQPEYAASVPVLLTGQDRRIGGDADWLLVERQAGQDVTPGQRVTFFRRLHGEEGPVSVVGQGRVQTVSERTFSVDVLAVRDAVYVGDLVAVHR